MVKNIKIRCKRWKKLNVKERGTEARTERYTGSIHVGNGRVFLLTFLPLTRFYRCSAHFSTIHSFLHTATRNPPTSLSILLSLIHYSLLYTNPSPILVYILYVLLYREMHFLSVVTLIITKIATSLKNY